MVMLFVGRFVDKVGLKRGLAATFLLWNIASIAHAFVRSLTGFMAVRTLLGIGESGMYPGAVKTSAEWFPIKERSVAMGIFNAGSNLGIIFSSIFGVAIAERYGWRECFFVTGGAGIIWIFFWRTLYRPPAEHPKVSPSELAYIHSDAIAPVEQISYSQLFGMRPVYALALAKALTDGPWWFVLLWLPKIIVDQFHVTGGFMAIALPVVYIVGDGGSVFGGWLSSWAIRRGIPTGSARKLVMLICASAIVPVASVGFLVDHPAIAGIPCVYLAVTILAVAGAGHQGWSTNLFTLISDTVPKSSLAMAAGAINGFAMVGVAVMQIFVGGIVQVTGSYTIPFIVAGCLYLFALLVLQVIMPKVHLYPTERRASIPAVVFGGILILVGLGFMQYKLSRPPYDSLTDYLAQRGPQVHATGAASAGPAAAVGWMQSQWYAWPEPGGKPKIELIKFDTHGHPFIEDKGDKVKGYRGPTLPEVQRTLGSAERFLVMPSSFWVLAVVRVPLGRLARRRLPSPFTRERVG